MPPPLLGLLLDGYDCLGWISSALAEMPMVGLISDAQPFKRSTAARARELPGPRRVGGLLRFLGQPVQVRRCLGHPLAQVVDLSSERLDYGDQSTPLLQEPVKPEPGLRIDP